MEFAQSAPAHGNITNAGVSSLEARAWFSAACLFDLPCATSTLPCQDVLRQVAIAAVAAFLNPALESEDPIGLVGEVDLQGSL
jgi:hypothetical protein